MELALTRSFFCPVRASEACHGGGEVLLPGCARVGYERDLDRIGDVVELPVLGAGADLVCVGP